MVRCIAVEKNDVAEVPPEQTPVWECESEDCLGWMRKNFSFEKTRSNALYVKVV